MLTKSFMLLAQGMSVGEPQKATEFQFDWKEIGWGMLRELSRDSIDKSWGERIKEFVEDMNEKASEAVAKEEAARETREALEKERDRQRYDDLMHGRGGDSHDGHSHPVDARDHLDHMDSGKIDA